MFDLYCRRASPRSSAGQSGRLLSDRSEVRILSGAPEGEERTSVQVAELKMPALCAKAKEVRVDHVAQALTWAVEIDFHDRVETICTYR